MARWRTALTRAEPDLVQANGDSAFIASAQGALGLALTDQALRPFHAGAFGKADPAAFAATCTAAMIDARETGGTCSMPSAVRRMVLAPASARSPRRWPIRSPCPTGQSTTPTAQGRTAPTATPAGLQLLQTAPRPRRAPQREPLQLDRHQPHHELHHHHVHHAGKDPASTASQAPDKFSLHLCTQLAILGRVQCLSIQRRNHGNDRSRHPRISRFADRLH